MQTATLLPSIEEQTSFRNGSRQNTSQHHQQHMGRPNKYGLAYKNPLLPQCFFYYRIEKKESQQIVLSAFS